MEKNNNLHVIKQTDPNFLRVVEIAIQQGDPVMLENILEEVDAALGMRYKIRLEVKRFSFVIKG